MKFNRVLLSFLHDLAAAALAFAFSMLLRLGSDGLLKAPLMPWLSSLGIFAATCAIVFLATGVYRGVWRYVSVRDLATIVKAVTIAVLIFVPVGFLLNRLEGTPRSLPGIIWFVLTAFMSGSRILVRVIKEGRLDNFWRLNRQSRINVLLVGSMDELELFIRAQQVDKQSPYHIIGALDDKGTRTGRYIHNIAVLGSMDELSRAVKELKTKNDAPARLILSRTASRRKDFDTFLAEAQTLGLSLSRMPSVTDLQEGSGNNADVKPIALEDLLGRPETVLDRQAIETLVRGKRVLVTGAGGTIGSELTRQIAALNPAQLVLVENSEFNLYTIDLEMTERHPALALVPLIADVRDGARIMQIFAQHKPDLVFHAAALKHVPMAEANARETVLTNIIGTRNVADAARKNSSAVMVLISTDKAVRPANVMGATKRVAEHYCQALDYESAGPTRFLTVRFGNVLGSTGSVVPRFREQLAKGGPLTVTHPDITRYFMTVREAVELVLQASAHATTADRERGKIMVLDMGAPVKIADLARQMIRLAGLRPDEDVKITYTGLRPGEKLYEELFSESEQLTPSGADGVFLAAASPLSLHAVQSAVVDLEQIVRNTDAQDSLLRSKITALVPEFISQKAA